MVNSDSFKRVGYNIEVLEFNGVFISIESHKNGSYTLKSDGFNKKTYLFLSKFEAIKAYLGYIKQLNSFRDY